MRDIQNEQKKYGDKNTAEDTVNYGYKHITNIDMIDDTPAMILNDDGIITDCNGACTNLLGCPQAEVIWQHISKFLPQIHDAMLFNNHQLNPHLRYLSHIGHHFKAVKNDGTLFFSKIFFVELGNTYESFIRVIIRPIQPEATYS